MVYIRFLTFNIPGVILLMEFIIQPPVQSTGSIHNHSFYNAVNALLFIRNSSETAEEPIGSYFSIFFRPGHDFLQNELI